MESVRLASNPRCGCSIILLGDDDGGRDAIHFDMALPSISNTSLCLHEPMVHQHKRVQQ